MDRLTTEVFDAVCRDHRPSETVKEVVRRLRAGGMSDVSIRAMLVEQKPVQGPPAGWPQPRMIVSAADDADLATTFSSEEEMASDVAEVMRGLTHESELRAERVRLGADEDRMRRSFTRG